MQCIYLTGVYGKLKQKNNLLFFQKEDHEEISLNTKNMFAIFIFGKIEITTTAIQFLFKNKIILTFLDSYGNFLGNIQPALQPSPHFHYLQYESFQNEVFVKELILETILGKIKNQHNFLVRLLRKSKISQIEENIRSIEKIIKQISLENDKKQIVGYEGISSKIYFESLRLYLKTFHIDFPKRTKQPPEDPFNATLGFIASLLQKRLHAILFTLGFDSHLGFLHDFQYQKPTLSFDMIEPLRTPLVDSLAISLFTKKILKEENFEKNEEEKSCYLSHEGCKIVCTEFEKRLDKELNYYSKKESYRNIIFLQLHMLKEAILSHGKEDEKKYKSFYRR